MPESTDVKPTDEELVEAFEQAMARRPREEADEIEAIRRIKRAWATGEISKKAAYTYIGLGVVNDELEAYLEE